MRVGQRKLRPEVSVASEEYKKQFQTSKANMGRGRISRDISGNFSASEYCNWRKKERVHHGRNIGETMFGCLKQKTSNPKQKTANAKQKRSNAKQKTEMAKLRHLINRQSR